jgi:hypothetical protein
VAHRARNNRVEDRAIENASSLVLPNIRVDFDWRGDRYGHAVSVLVDDAWRELLRSQEGEPDDPWPPSPPLQHLIFSKRQDGATIALLVGSAGSSHWSMSVEPLGDRKEYLFDVACCGGGQPIRVGSAYFVSVDVRCDNPPSSRWLFEYGATCSIGSIPEDECQCSIAVESRRLLVAPEPFKEKSTARWRYAVRYGSEDNFR